MICEECGNNIDMGYAETTGHKTSCSSATLPDRETLDETDEDHPDGEDTEQEKL